MPSLTLENIPEPLLERLRRRAEADRRSLTQEILHLLEAALEQHDRPDDAERAAPDQDRDRHQARNQAQAQADAWEALGGRWRSDLEPGEEIDRILASRTRGRQGDL